jgi:hypothetical protein
LLPVCSMLLITSPVLDPAAGECSSQYVKLSATSIKTSFENL